MLTLVKKMRKYSSTQNPRVSEWAGNKREKLRINRPLKGNFPPISITRTNVFSEHREVGRGRAREGSRASMWHTEWWNDIALSFSSRRGYLPWRQVPLISFLSYRRESYSEEGNITQEIYRHCVSENSFVSQSPLSSATGKHNISLLEMTFRIARWKAVHFCSSHCR